MIITITVIIYNMIRVTIIKKKKKKKTLPTYTPWMRHALCNVHFVDERLYCECICEYVC